mmetsp:Transcript_28458/g.71590  ORF Transcript_28458/g.71590 Transcript_28458/m.71590 type:complete len:314 (-) Transcript_28458:181-1122(-)
MPRGDQHCQQPLRAARRRGLEHDGDPELRLLGPQRDVGQRVCDARPRPLPRKHADDQHAPRHKRRRGRQPRVHRHGRRGRAQRVELHLERRRDRRRHCRDGRRRGGRDDGAHPHHDGLDCPHQAPRAPLPPRGPRRRQQRDGPRHDPLPQRLLGRHVRGRLGGPHRLLRRRHLHCHPRRHGRHLPGLRLQRPLPLGRGVDAGAEPRGAEARPPLLLCRDGPLAPVGAPHLRRRQCLDPRRHHPFDHAHHGPDQRHHGRGAPPRLHLVGHPPRHRHRQRRLLHGPVERQPQHPGAAGGGRADGHDGRRAERHGR